MARLESHTEIEAAPLGRRIGAFFIDAGMQVLLIGVMGAIFSDLHFSERGIAAGLLIVSAVYGIGFIGMTSSTPGKMAVGMWVSDAAGQRVLPDRAILRYLVIAVPNLTLLGILRDQETLSLIAWGTVTGVILAANLALGLTDSRRRLIHDRIAGTLAINGRPPELPDS